MNAKAHVVTAVALGALTLVGARAMASPDQSAPSIASVVDGRISSIEKRVVGVAEAMPEEKYSFVPTNGEFKGVMSFADQIKHIGDDNYGAFGAFLTETHPAGPAGTSKAELVAYVRGAFAFAHRAVATISSDNAVTPLPKEPRLTRLGLALEEIGHSENHYGQLVEYLRMNGIIPPASRPQTK